MKVFRAPTFLWKARKGMETLTGDPGGGAVRPLGGERGGRAGAALTLQERQLSQREAAATCARG